MRVTIPIVELDPTPWPSFRGDFDRAFFGIRLREAQAVDPQQRPLLEATWEALERATIDPSSLRGSDTGVFIGAAGHEYGTRIYEETEGFAGYLATGTPTCIASGRVAYTLGLQGPAVTERLEIHHV
jgi:acyl transferase domain-containing protein